MLEFDLLKVFLAVAERGGFTRAAQALNRTQSAVSMQIQRLEDSVGATLFHRSGRRIRLTSEGEILVGYARRILALGDEALGSVAARSLAGTVRMGCIDDYATRMLPNALAAFWRANPAVLVEVCTGLTDHLLQRLGTDYDLVLGMHPAGLGAGSLLRRDKPIWATSPAHSVHEEEPLPLALYPEGCLFRRWAVRALDAAGRPWRCAYLSPSLGAVEAAVRAGLAVSVFKETTVGDHLRRLLPSDGMPELPEVEIRLHLAAGGLSRQAATLAEHLLDSLRPAVAA